MHTSAFQQAHQVCGHLKCRAQATCCPNYKCVCATRPVASHVGIACNRLICEPAPPCLSHSTICVSLIFVDLASGEAPSISCFPALDQQAFLQVRFQNDGTHCGYGLLVCIEAPVDLFKLMLVWLQARYLSRKSACMSEFSPEGMQPAVLLTMTCQNVTP